MVWVPTPAAAGSNVAVPSRLSVTPGPVTLLIGSAAALSGLYVKLSTGEFTQNADARSSIKISVPTLTVRVIVAVQLLASV